MNADEYEEYISNKIAIGDAIIKTFRIDTSKILVEEDKTNSVILWFNKGTENRYICRFIEYPNPMGIRIYINNDINEYFSNSKKINLNKELADTIVNYIRKKSGTNKEIRIYVETADGKTISLF